MVDKDQELLKLFERDEFEKALKYFDANKDEVYIDVCDGYGIRNAMNLKGYGIVKELVKRGSKLSSRRYEAVNVFLEQNKYEVVTEFLPYDMFKFIFTNIDKNDPDKPTIDKIATSRGITIDEIEFLLEIGYCDFNTLKELAVKYIYDWTISIDPAYTIFLHYGIELPKPTDKILEAVVKNVELFEYYYKNYKEKVIKYFKSADCYPSNEVYKYIIDNNITDIYDCNKILTYLFHIGENKSYIEKYIKNNLDKINIRDEIGLFCYEDYDGFGSIEDKELENLKLCLKYDLIDIRAENDRFYHHAYITNSKKAIKFLKTIYNPLTLKK
jgi:hypothetical protein